MKPVDSAELSALLDGELSPGRAAEVRRALAEDSELRTEFENLSAVHSDLIASAEAAKFHPRISLAGGTWFPAAGIIGFAVAMLALRLVVKLIPLGVGAVVQLAALTLVLWWVVSYLLRVVDDEHWKLAQQATADMG